MKKVLSRILIAHYDNLVAKCQATVYLYHQQSKYVQGHHFILQDLFSYLILKALCDVRLKIFARR